MCRNVCRDPLTRCPACEAERLLQLEEWHEFDLICESNPENDPAHKPATDDEWRAWREATTVPARKGAA